MSDLIFAPGAATYNGNVGHIIGEVKGPTTYGTWLVAAQTVYDSVTDTTLRVIRDPESAGA